MKAANATGFVGLTTTFVERIETNPSRIRRGKLKKVGWMVWGLESAEPY